MTNIKRVSIGGNVEVRDINDFFDTEQASCKGEDITIFYPDYGSRYMFNRASHSKQVLTAKEICASCKVLKGCLEYSLHFEPLGVWGGKTEVEREVLRRQKGIQLPPDRKSSPSVRRSVNAGRVGRTVTRLGSLNE